MIRLCAMALSLTGLLAGGARGAEDEARRCNLQARELALRVAEQGLAELDAGQRERLARLAEEVCLEYRLPASAWQEPEPAPPVEAPEDASGLFGDMKLIDPEDRVRRPGLKRR